MSSTRRKKTLIGGIALTAALGLGVSGLLGGAVTGADFSATDNFHATTDTATLTIELGSPEHGYTTNFDLSFDNLAPGEHVDRQFWVKNTGSIPASVSLTDRTISNTAGAALTGADWEFFRTGIVGYSDQAKSNAGLNADLGVLQPGESRAYTLRKSLEGAAGNNWQGVTVGSNVVVTLNQL